jgi:PleD family two-component response regulator
VIQKGSQAPAQSSEAGRPIAVLLVDDSPFIGAVLKRLFATEPDIELHCCRHALEAVARANEIGPAVILQDLVLPDIDGLTMVRLFRANPSTADTPIIVLSGNDDDDTRARALAEGAVDYLVKVPPKSVFVDCIRRHAAPATGTPGSVRGVIPIPIVA